MGLKEGSEEKEQKNIPQDELFKVVADLQKQIADLKEKQTANAQPVMSADDIAKIIAATKDLDKKDLDYQGGIKEEDIPVEDWDEKGVRFCAPFVGYCIVDDVRKGQRILLPYGKRMIFFDYAATRRMQQGKYEGVSVYSVYTSHSKRETKWIREHSYYGVYFYESSTLAMNADAVKAQRIAKFMRVLDNYELDALLKRCKEYDVPMGEDASVMRSHLAFKMAEREVQAELSATQKHFEDAHKEAMLVTTNK